MQNNLDLAMHQKKNESTKLCPLSMITEQVKRGEISIPVWQRGNHWTKKNREEFMGYIKDLDYRGRDLLTTIITCQLEKEEYRNCYLLDGNQRIRAIIESLRGDNDLIIKKAVESVCANVSHRNYYDHEEAAMEYQLVNKGTHLTDYDYHKIPLTQLDNWLKINEGLEHYKNRYIGIFQQYTSLPTTMNYTLSMKEMRTALCFYWYLVIDDGEREKPGYPTDSFFIPGAGHTALNNSLEKQIKVYWENKSYFDIEAEFDKTINDIRNITVLVNEIFREIVGERKKEGITNQDTVLRPMCLRFILQVYIWGHKLNKKEKQFEKWVKSFLEYQSGSTYWYLKENGKVVEARTLSFKNQIYKDILANTDSVYFEDISRKSIKTPKGYDGSHIKPYSEYPKEQELIEEPTLRNKARGAEILQ